MAYSKEVVRRARQRLETAKAERESENLRRLQEAYRQVPRLKEIDVLLRKSMALAAQAAFSRGGDAREAMEQVRDANLALQRERKMLADAHFEKGYLEDRPICGNCGGSGYVGSTMCGCLAELCRQEQKKELSLLACGEGRFEDFRLEYYSDVVDSKLGHSPRTIMERCLRVSRNYAQQFGCGSGNLLFFGGTGLGKTMLSACVATEVAERGYSVAYESAHNLFAKLEKDRFSPSEESRAAVERLHDCDLLIIDDLGTELPGNFVTAALYNLVNERLLAGKPMLISTNLTAEEIGRRYSPQIASRLQGSFQWLIFVGEDIRIKKNRGAL